MSTTLHDISLDINTNNESYSHVNHTILTLLPHTNILV